MCHDILPVTNKMLSKICSEKSFTVEPFSDSEIEEENDDEIAYLEKLLEYKYLEEKHKKTIIEILEAKKKSLQGTQYLSKSMNSC